jgi:hypothetical protein
VTVYRLLCAKTYEVKMCERASHKLALDKVDPFIHSRHPIDALNA